MESYVNKIMSRSNRSALAMLRCGVAPIRVETGRYEGLNLEDRICPLCDSTEIEDELHFLIKCPVYEDLKIQLYREAVLVNPLFNDLNDTDKLCFLLSNNDIVHFSRCRWIFLYN